MPIRPAVSAAIIAVSLAACAQSKNTPHPQPSSHVVDDASIGVGENHFQYAGTWEHVRGRRDGRYAGTSSRSYHIGDSAVLTFDGSRVLLYGVDGSNGGEATVAIDGQFFGLSTFHSSRKRVGVLVFASPRLAAGPHALGLVISGSNAAHARAYINIDYARIFP